MAWLVRRYADNIYDTLMALHTSGDSIQHACWINESGTSSDDKPEFYDNDAGSSHRPSSMTITQADGWVLFVLRHDDSANTVHFSKLPIGGAWTHQSAACDATLGAVTGGSLLLGASEYGAGSSLDWAAFGEWNSFLSEAAVEDLGGVAALADWHDAEGADHLLMFDQASVATAVTDYTGNGADQTAITGTSVLEEDPPIPYEAGAAVEPTVGVLTVSAAAPGVLGVAVPAVGGLVAAGSVPSVTSAFAPASGGLAVSGGAVVVGAVAPPVGELVVAASAPSFASVVAPAEAGVLVVGGPQPTIVADGRQGSGILRQGAG
jgi:hypothetical protein